MALTLALNIKMTSARARSLNFEGEHVILQFSCHQYAKIVQLEVFPQEYNMAENLNGFGVGCFQKDNNLGTQIEIIGKWYSIL